MTLTDLNNTVKRNNFVKNYIYYFHAAVSTTKNYTATAFDNYDIILCNGDYQVKEIRQREKLVNLKEKKLIKSGYFYFDYLQRKINYKIIPDEILIAPSWNYNQKNFINENLELIIKEILQKGYKVRFRPHPEHFVRSKNKIEYICNKFKNELFKLDSSIENKESMEKAKCLITDNSGIAIEYILLFKKPVLYFDDVDKIHNKEFDKYKNLPTMDNMVKDKFGFSFTINEIKSLDLIIQKSISEFRNKDNEIKIFTNKNFYNFNQTIKKFEDLTHKYFD
jgi:YidC/Oxa1 family membrane protein insertase